MLTATTPTWIAIGAGILPAHATSHESGGSDSIKLDDLAAPDDNTDLDASTSKHGLLPKLGGGTDNFLRADGTWAAPPAIFGTQAQDAASDGESSTSSTSWVPKVTMTTPSLPAGRYRIGWNYEWRYDSIANNAIVRVQLDDSATLMEMQQEPKDAGSDQSINKAGFGYVTLGAGVHTIDLDYRSSNGTYSTYIKRARLEIWRVS
jgi:hypothetical protein